MRRVLIDTNIFVSAWVLDVVMSIADANLLEPRWTVEILGEFERVAHRLGRVPYMQGVIRSIVSEYPQAYVDGWREHLDGIELPDVDDRHVLAAAIAGDCDCIVTFNLRDFPASVLECYGIRAISPDDLMMELVKENPLVVLDVIMGLIRSKARPERTYDEEIAGLRRCRMPRFADWLDS